MKAADPLSRIKQARAKLAGDGMIPEGLVPDPIARSWKRCLSMGISVEEKQNFDPVPAGDLSSIHEQSRVLLAHAEPVMDTLREQILNTGSMVILTDASGLILRSIGDADFMSKAKRVALQSGVSWNENSKGTNAIGTSLAEEKPVTVHGDQHFISANTFLTCSASPIANPEGNLIGVLDVSGDYRSFQQHTLALVRMSVQMIENRLFREQYPECALLRFHSRPEFIGTLCEGIAVFSEDGRVLSANRSALFQLGMDLPRLRQLSFESLFSLPFSALLDRIHTHRPLALNLHNGVRVFTVIETSSALERRMAAPTAPLSRLPRPIKRDLKSVPSFASLDSGDECVAAIVRKLRRVVDRDIPVLIIGETGAGKELFARALHNESLRADGPFVPVNCAAIPDGLVESELFGYEEAHLPARGAKARPARCSRRTAAHCSSMKLATCRLAFRRDFCACFRSEPSLHSAARSRDSSTFALSVRPTRSCAISWNAAISDPTSTTG